MEGDRVMDGFGHEPLTCGKTAIWLTPPAILRVLGLPKLQGAMWSIALYEENSLVGVSIVGRPTARLLNDNCSVLQVLRCDVIVGTPNGCSMLYGATSKAARSLGAKDLLTYIHEDEIGTSLKASGWIFDEEFQSNGGEWNRPSGPREKTVESEAKKRYWAPWGEYAKELLERKGKLINVQSL